MQQPLAPTTPDVQEPAAAGGRTLDRRLLFLPAAFPLALWIWWAVDSGGYFEEAWYPGGIVMVLLVGVVGVGSGRLLPQGRGARVALGLLAGFVAWSFLSILWADAPAAAWEAADQWLLYLATGWLFLLLPWRPDSATVLLCAWSLGVAVVCAIALIAAPGTDDLGRLANEARFSAPLDYPNGTSALAVLAFLPALALCTRRGLPAAVQAAAFTVAVFLLQFALLPQSRGAVLGLAVAAPVFALLAPRWLALVPRLLVIAGVMALGAGEILDAAGREATRADLEGAIAAIWRGTAIAAVAGTAIALVERWARDREGARTRLRAAGVALVAALTLGAAVLAVANGGRIADKVDEQLDTVGANTFEGESRLTSLAPEERFDYWEESLDLFSDAPLTGAGAGNFEHHYTIHREFTKPSRFPHNVWVGALGELGLVGLLLLAGFVVAAGATLVRRRLRAAEPASWVIASTAAMGGYFFAHAAFDWMEKLPAVAAPVFGALFAALAATAARPARAGTPVAVAAVALAVAGTLSLALPYLSGQLVQRAIERSRAEPAEAFSDLDRAAGLNPLSARPRLIEGAIAITRDDLELARRSFRRALERERTWYPYFELALIAADQRRWDDAEPLIRQARRLNRAEPVVAQAQRRIRRRGRVSAQAFNRSLVQESTGRLKP